MGRKIRSVSVFLSVFLVVASIFGGCGKVGAPGKNDQGESQDPDPKSTEVASDATKEALPKQIGYDVKKELQAYSNVMPLTVFADYGNMQTSKDDLTVKWVKENLKIDISGLEINPSGSFADKIRTKVATKDLPDFIFGFDLGLFQSMANGGDFLPMDDLIKNYMPGVHDFIGQPILDKYKSNDGKQYIMPGGTIPVDDMSTYVYVQVGPAINTDVLKKTGMKTPKTPDELYKYLKAAVGQVASNGNKIIPLALTDLLPSSYGNNNYPINGNSIDNKALMHMFDVGTTYHYCYKNDDTQMIDIIYDRPSYATYIKYLSKLYRENLLDKDIFTMSSDQYTERLKSGSYGFIYAHTNDVPPANSVLSGTVLKPYEPIEMLKDANITGSTKFVVVPVLGNWYFLFNKNVSDPSRLAKYLEWNYTLEGVQIINYGAPDKTMTINNWYYEDDGKVNLDMELQTKWDASNYGWEWLRAGGWGIHAAGLKPPLKYTAINEMGVCMADDFFKTMDVKVGKETTSDPSFEAMMLQPKGPWFEKRGPALNDLLNKWEVKIILTATSDADVDNMYSQMMVEARKVGYDEMKKELYTLYKSANK